MPRSRNPQADALAAEAAAAGVPHAEATKTIAAATGISARQARRYTAEADPINTADRLERLAQRLEQLFMRAEASGDFKAAGAISKQLMDAYHRLDLARDAQAHHWHDVPF